MAQHRYVGALLRAKRGCELTVKLPMSYPWAKDSYVKEAIFAHDVLLVFADDRESSSWRTENLRCLNARLGVCWLHRAELTLCHVMGLNTT